MKEDFLQYVWKTQQFCHQSLRTTEGQRVTVQKAGLLNLGQGPDFSAACLRIEEILWRGDVEVHVDDSEWYGHRHHKDPVYNGVIAHVVWEASDRIAVREDGSKIPTIVLKGRLQKEIFQRKDSLPLKAGPLIPCGNFFNSVPPSVRHKMLERALFIRLGDKQQFLRKLLRKNKEDTEVTTYHLLGHAFGFKGNSENFLTLVNKVPLRLVKLHYRDIRSLEALLFGQAGFLSSDAKLPLSDPYVQELLKKYESLKSKHTLPTHMTARDWHFCRLRPANFPTIRIAQFAHLLHRMPNLFSSLLNSSAQQLKKKLSVQQSEYWRHHYMLAKKSTRLIGGLGAKSVNSLLINTVVPLLIYYGKIRDNAFFIDRGMKILKGLAAESNQIVDGFQKLGFKAKNAFESQALLGLYHHFCSRKKCLSCTIGHCILTKKKS